MAYNVTATFGASDSPNVTVYVLSWTKNGTAMAAQSIPRTSAGDSGGYATDYLTANPTDTLAAGDVVTASVVADDAPDSLVSTPDVGNVVTIPTPPPVTPDAPTNLTLAITGP